LEERRVALLRSIGDLEDAREAGALEVADYERLRGDSEIRMVMVLRAIDRRERAPSHVAAVPSEVRIAEPRRVPPWAVAVLIGGTVAAMVVAALVRDTSPLTQASSAPSAQAGDPFEFFEERVRQNPDDLAARLDLAHRYLDAGRVDEALDEYAVALELDPDDAEAHAHVGIILYLADRPEEALASVDRALATDPDYPEALFFRGVILLRGLDRPADGIDAFERYLEAAPFGAERQTVQELIAEAQAGLAEL
jgi:cytochrome c-type biogenesis protein CcmH/NrfG